MDLKSRTKFSPTSEEHLNQNISGSKLTSFNVKQNHKNTISPHKVQQSSKIIEFKEMKLINEQIQTFKKKFEKDIL